jgi:hypothetical protein
LGRLSLITHVYVWVKTFNLYYIDLKGLAIKSDDSMLAVSAEYKPASSSSYVLIILFVDPITGIKKSNNVIRRFDNGLEIDSFTLLFAGKNRLYVTGRV